MRYDPHQHVDPDSWLALDESERIESVSQYHRRKKIRLPNETLHALMHVIIENQVALGDAYPARAVLFRLMEEGLDRHEAVHAIACALSDQIFVALKHEGAKSDLNSDYLKRLERQTAESWRKQGR